MSAADRRFGARLRAAMDSRGPVCVGVDPHPHLLQQWGLADDASGLRAFGSVVLDAVGPHVAAIKPQSAFYERHGSAGIAALEELLGQARDRGVLTILDVKRGDIGSTMGGYAQAYLRDGAPLAADAITLSPYLGTGSLRPAIDLALETGRGAFILALTSNPEGPQVQHARGADGLAVAAQVARDVAQWNAHERALVGGDTDRIDMADAAPSGSFGLVVGATVGDAPRALGVDLAVGGMLLAPGVGAQGGGPRELQQVFASARSAVLASTSRGVLNAGPDHSALAEAARATVSEATKALAV